MSNTGNSGGSWIPAAATGLATGMFGWIGAGKRAKKAHKRNKEMMGIQFANQQKLNEQGQALQMKTWQQTGYGAQMKMMKEAGLNPGLMYGMSGGGGQSVGSQGGGSASANQAHAPMEIGSQIQAGLQASMLAAQIENVKADTKQKEADAGLKGQGIEESKQKILESISKAELNAKLGITEDSKVKLNESIEKLNEAKEKEAINNIKLTDEDLKWMDENGINRNDSMIVKTLKHVAKVSGLSEKAVLNMIGGVLAARELTNMVGNIIPIGKALKGVKQIKGFRP